MAKNAMTKTEVLAMLPTYRCELVASGRRVNVCQRSLPRNDCPRLAWLKREYRPVAMEDASAANRVYI